MEKTYPDWPDSPTFEPAVLVGGPLDGQAVALPDLLSESEFLVIAPVVEFLVPGYPVAIPPARKATYRLTERRADDGREIYDFASLVTL